MGILFMMPQWEAASEVWMQRMLEILADDLVVIVVNDSQGERLWRGRVPVVSLRPAAREIPLISSALSRVGLSLHSVARRPETILRFVLQKYPVTHIFCQYGTYAVKFMKTWRETTLPLTIHFHGYDVMFDLRHVDTPEKEYFEPQYVAALQELEGRATFIAGSEYLKSRLVEAGFSSESILVKYYGVPLPDQVHKHKSTTKVQILHLGRLVDFKSPDRTILAYELARENGLQGTLVMVGDGPLRSMCELLRYRSRYRDDIYMLHSVSAREALDLYLQSDIFTQHNITGELTRQVEGFGVSIVEAMACGLPVIGTRSGGAQETIVDGVTGLLNTPGDVSAQAEAFLRLAGDPALRTAFGLEGRARVAQLFSPSLEAESLHKLFKRVVPVPSSNP